MGVSARPYTVHASSIPATPGESATIHDPTGAAPIAGLAIIEHGGPTWNVKGNYHSGAHFVHNGVLTVAAREGDPYLPGQPAYGSYDFSIDMIGHAHIQNFQVCIPFYNLCIGIGTINAGSAVAQFDAEDIVLPTGDAVSTAFPMLP